MRQGIPSMSAIHPSVDAIHYAMNLCMTHDLQSLQAHIYQPNYLVFLGSNDHLNHGFPTSHQPIPYHDTPCMNDLDTTPLHQALLPFPQIIRRSSQQMRQPLMLWQYHPKNEYPHLQSREYVYFLLQKRSEER